MLEPITCRCCGQTIHPRDNAGKTVTSPWLPLPTRLSWVGALPSVLPLPV